jgi:hypothetical protein
MTETKSNITEISIDHLIPSVVHISDLTRPFQTNG